MVWALAVLQDWLPTETKHPLQELQLISASVKNGNRSTLVLNSSPKKENVHFIIIYKSKAGFGLDVNLILKLSREALLTINCQNKISFKQKESYLDQNGLSSMYTKLRDNM